MAEPSPVRVLIADDQEMVREGFAVLLASQPGIEIAGTAADGVEALARVAELRPDVVLMDVRMPEMDGLEATAQIVASTSDTKVLILTTYDLDEYVYQALCAGASGFLLKDASARQLAEGVRVVAAGDSLLSPSSTRRLITEFTRLAGTGAGGGIGAGNGGGAGPLPPARSGIPELTERETAVLALIAQGLSNTEIGDHLFVTESTVKTHVSKVLVKLGLRDRTQAAIYAYEHGVVVIGGRD
ncbi:response regulator transcription factor [Streptomyces sp. BE147]|uniref:response regulator transcription factor n=1 Tax=Streptomyces sp. BE147 TaxID=3002524 RepID=UPI002E7A36BB|nr:response regulator transcription factor [Streptomyces sp. BE147]MEE1740538.1 response regulator transcription factor [Streptomyces sp. BE147]